MTALMIISIVWIIGTLLAARVMLTHRLNRLDCSRYRDFDIAWCQKNHPKGCAQLVGQYRERTIGDALISIAQGLAWPVVLSAAFVSRTTPATRGEQQRIMAEQAAEITRLTAQIEDRK